ncbi:CotH kinase family protein [Peptococcaceae bacterium 1198_IL3148]
MIKNKYIWGVFGLLFIIFTGSIIILPRLGLEASDVNFAYVERVFDQSKVTTVNITLAESDLTKILEDPLAEEIVEATVEINGEKVEHVGLRVKGNSSLSSVARMEDSDRYSFKIDFDYYNGEQNLYGLKKLNLNNNFSDATQMKEYVSYKLIAEMGLPSPANSYMYVTINGKEWGLYLGVEQIDEIFIARNFADSGGDLYKPEGTGSDLKWISDDIKDYPGLILKTNVETSDQSAMINFLAAINHGGDIASHVDVDEMLRYFATNTALVSLDSYQGPMKHNYYLYEQDDVFSIIPWDYNMAFGGFAVGGARNREIDKNEQVDQTQNPANKNADVPNRKFMGMPGNQKLINENSINFSITTPVSGTTLADRPLLNALLSVAEYREQYEAHLKEIAINLLTEEHIQSITQEVAAIILPYVERDPTKFYTTEEFKQGVSGENSLPEFAAQRSASILAQLSGELVVEAETGGFEPGNMRGIMEKGPDNMMPPNLGENNGGGATQPDFNGGERLPMEPGGFNNNGQHRGAPGGFMPEEQRVESGGQIYMETVVASSAVLVGAIVFVSIFKRRKYR